MYQEFIDDLENFLLRYNISYKSTNVFVDSLFQLAGINKSPKKAEFFVAENKPDRLAFKIKHIPEYHARQFLSFLVRETDETAICKLQEGDKEVYYYFEAPLNDVHNFILPSFQIYVLQNLSTLQFDKYREQSNHCAAVTEYKLKNELEILENQYTFITKSIHFFMQHNFPLKIAQALRNVLASPTAYEKLQQLKRINQRLAAYPNADLTIPLSHIKEYCELYEQNLLEQTSGHKQHYFLNDAQLEIYKKFTRKEKTTPTKPVEKTQSTAKTEPAVKPPREMREEDPAPAVYTYFGV